MLGRSAYSEGYVQAVRARFGRVLKAFDKAKPAEPFASEALIDMVLGLEVAFVHRLRMQEGKDGNVLNEVRMLATSVLENDGVLMSDKTIKWTPEKSVSRLAIGDKVVLTRKQVEALAAAFFDEISKKYR
jgi:hypothetical protein